jgi:SAM-dependent methyltransferase
MDAGYYRADLSMVHHKGFGFHADMCAPGIPHHLEPVLERGGGVVELGCGSGLLTRHLVDAGHRVIATDASPAMLDLTRQYVPKADVRQLMLPDDPIPAADAIVSTGHPLNYLADEAAVDRALVGCGSALRPGGVLAVDLCDLEWGQARVDAAPVARLGDDWAIITLLSVPAPNQFVRKITTFLRDDEGSWRRDDETHHNVLVDTTLVPDLLAGHGVEAEVLLAFGSEEFPVGLRAIVGQKTG